MQHREFQTKSLESCLEHYTITAEWELWITKGEREWVADPSSMLGGYAKVIREWDERVEDYHGDIYFYDIREQVTTREPMTFRARFTHGKLESIIVVPDRT